MYTQHNLIDLQPMSTYYITVSATSIAGETAVASDHFNITTSNLLIQVFEGEGHFQFVIDHVIIH